MDLQLNGRTALVCASSQGLGYACAAALAAEGATVFINGRSRERLAEVAAALRAVVPGADVEIAPGDLTDTVGRSSILAACQAPDILVNNNAGPPPGDLAEQSLDDLRSAVEGNYLAAVELTRAVLPAMRARKFGRIINITSAMVTTPRPMMVASAGARAALTAAMKAISVEVAPYGVTVNNLLPERIDSPRQVQVAHFEAERHGISFDEARRRQAGSIAARRLGRPEELGATCAFLCSPHAGYISGMNLHLDGGSYPGLI